MESMRCRSRISSSTCASPRPRSIVWWDRRAPATTQNCTATSSKLMSLTSKLPRAFMTSSLSSRTGKKLNASTQRRLRCAHRKKFIERFSRLSRRAFSPRTTPTADPMGFDQYLGNERITGALRGMLRRERVPSALLFTGPRGIGKYTLARMFAQAANCERLKDDFCGECASCRRTARLADPGPLIEAGLAERGESADAATVERTPLIIEG